MNTIMLDNTLVYYTIVFKANKNTYFYFKPNNTINIHASKRQSEQEIITYIMIRKDAFIQKLAKINYPKVDSTYYHLWGEEYYRESTLDSPKITVDYQSHTIYEPETVSDQLKSLYHSFEKAELLQYLHQLHQKYLSNQYVDISNVIYKTRYTKTRFGSCNPRIRSININLDLVHYDKQFTEYVFVHELAHLVHQNHSHRFYQLVEKLLPTYKTLRKALKETYKKW